MANFRGTWLFNVLRSIKHSSRNKYNEVMGKRPRLPVETRRVPLVTLGTDYGSWTFVDSPSLKNSTIISCGAGEDISFDLLFAVKYGARVVIVDPTPRASDHVRNILKVIEKAVINEEMDNLELYGFKQFRGLKPSQIFFLEKAVWSDNGLLKFFPPKNTNHVSHSALDYQNYYRQSGDFIEVEAVTYQHILAIYDIRRLPLLKLDIEGAEVEVLKSLSIADILPEQICVEYDELFYPNAKAAQRVASTHQHLVELGYRAIYKDGVGNNFLYLRANHN